MALHHLTRCWRPEPAMTGHEPGFPYVSLATEIIVQFRRQQGMYR